MYKSEGTPETTTLLDGIDDQNRGGVRFNGNNYPVEVNGSLYFTVVSPTNPNVHLLIKSDGTAAGSVTLKSFAAQEIYVPYNLTNFNGTLYFSAFTNTLGWELWKSDGTTAGTVLVANLATGNESSFPSNYVGMDNRLYFMTYISRWGLWSTDGTSAGTTFITDLDTSSDRDPAIPFEMVAIGSTLYFTRTTALGRELWSYSTATGVQLVRDILAGSGSGTPRNLTVVLDKLFFTANDGTTGDELWSSRGKFGNTVLVKDIAPGPASSNPNSFAAVGGLLMFAANDGVTGNELWRSGGTAETTTLVKDVNPGPASGNPNQLVNANGRLYFVANDGRSGNELWTSNRETAGTQLVEDIAPGTKSSHPTTLTAFGGKLYFSADDGIMVKSCGAAVAHPRQPSWSKTLTRASLVPCPRKWFCSRTNLSSQPLVLALVASFGFAAEKRYETLQLRQLLADQSWDHRDELGGATDMESLKKFSGD